MGTRCKCGSPEAPDAVDVMSAQLSTVLTRLWCQLRIEDGAKAATPRSLANETYITIVLGQRLHHAGGLRGGVPLGGI